MNYWQTRELIERQRLFSLTEKQIIALLRKQYIKVSADIQARLKAIYFEIKATGNATANQLWMQDKLYKLMSEIDNQLNALSIYENQKMTGYFYDYYEKVYRQSSLNLAPENELLISRPAIERAITANWVGDGKNFSDRIWGNKQQLLEKLNEGLVNVVATGKNWAILSKQIKHDFNVSFSDAKRLVRTELTHIEASACLQRYSDEGVTKVIYVAEPDACPICLPMNGHTYDINAVARIPQHPNCRCTYLAVPPDIIKKFPLLYDRAKQQKNI